MIDTVPVRISAKSMRQLFHGCEPVYIRDVCHGACCRSTTAPSGTIIRIAKFEAPSIEARGGIIAAGLLQSVDRRCPFQTPDTELCALHGTDHKPFGCIASPFILTRRRTLVVRNRYRLLKCYGAGMPAYKAFNASLVLLFGDRNAAVITELLDIPWWGDISADMPRRSYQVLRELEGKRGTRSHR